MISKCYRSFHTTVVSLPVIAPPPPPPHTHRIENNRALVTGFYLAQNLGGNMRGIEVMRHLGGPKGWMREGHVPLPVQSAGS